MPTIQQMIRRSNLKRKKDCRLCVVTLYLKALDTEFDFDKVDSFVKARKAISN